MNSVLGLAVIAALCGGLQAKALMTRSGESSGGSSAENELELICDKLDLIKDFVPLCVEHSNCTGVSTEMNAQLSLFVKPVLDWFEETCSAETQTNSASAGTGTGAGTGGGQGPPPSPTGQGPPPSPTPPAKRNGGHGPPPSPTPPAKRNGGRGPPPSPTGQGPPHSPTPPAKRNGGRGPPPSPTGQGPPPSPTPPNKKRDVKLQRILKYLLKSIQ